MARNHGFAVFSTLGYLGMAMGRPIDDLTVSGGGLAFVSYPTAIENFQMAMWLKGLLALGFFVMLLTLGVDSAFSIVEAVSAAVLMEHNVYGFLPGL